MREYGSNIILPSLDNLFSSEQERQDAKLEKIQILPLSELHPFEGHPFQVRDDEEMDKMKQTPMPARRNFSEKFAAVQFAC